MQFQVPQFIETEDKIVGPLTLRQFAYMGVAFLLSAVLYFTVELWLCIIGAIIFFSIAFAFSFVKIEGRSFANVILSAFHFYWKPQTYVWQPEHPTIILPKKIDADEKSSGLAEILAASAAKTKRPVHPVYAPATPVAKVVPPTKSAVAFQPKPQPQPQPVDEPSPISREIASAGSALHRAWEGIQTGTPLSKKSSDKQFLDK